MITKCYTCDKPLAINKTAWSCGKMFCSHKCGVDWAMTMYNKNEYSSDIELIAKATKYFGDVAEEISREDFGARVEYFTTYSKDYDISTIFGQVYEGDDLVSMAPAGWYYGEPSIENDEYYKDHMIAMFD